MAQAGVSAGSLRRQIPRFLQSARSGQAARWLSAPVQVLLFHAGLLSSVALAQTARPLTQVTVAPIERESEPQFSLPGFRQKKLSITDGEGLEELTGIPPGWQKAFGLRAAHLFTASPERVAVVLEWIDPAGAYGIFTQLVPAHAERSNWGQGGGRWDGRLLFWKANYSILLKGPDPAEVEQWARRLAGAIGREGTLPLVVDTLPKKGLQSDTVRFYVTDLLPADGNLRELRPLLGLSQSVQAVIGQYGSGGERITVLGYPTSALALDAFQRIEGFVRDKSHGMYAKRAGVILALTEGLPREQATSLLDAVHYTPTVKWISGKEPTRRGGGVRVLLDTVVGSLALSLLFVVATAALGTTLGFYRFYLRKLRPDNYFDRAERVGMVRLKLVDK